MLPLPARRRLRRQRCSVAMAKIDASATTASTPTTLARRRGSINAVIGVIVGPGLFILSRRLGRLPLAALGKDPVYLDDPSVLMPAPPADLTAASGALVYDGKTSRRALTTALLDLASRGELAFEEHEGLLKKKVAIRTHGSEPVDDRDAAQRRLNARRPIGDAESYALSQLRMLRRRPPRGRRPAQVRGEGRHVRRQARTLRRPAELVPRGPEQGRRTLVGARRARAHRRRRGPVRRDPDPVRRARRARRGSPRRRRRDPGRGPGDAGPDDRRAR